MRRDLLANAFHTRQVARGRLHDLHAGADAAGERDQPHVLVCRQQRAALASAVTRLNAPFGRSHSASNSVKSKALSGVSSLDLITMVLPVTNAGAILRAIRKNGKFQGRISATTPIARRCR